jgi:uncharacterized lipoprotein YmbA
MKFALFIVLLFTSGCSSSVPILQQYLLRTDAPVQYAAEQSGDVIGLGALVVAPYIDGLGLVLETRAGEVRAARDHRWAEPLRESLRTYMAREISQGAGQLVRANNSGEIDWQRRIDLHIDELHGTAAGEARLVAYWTIFDTDQRRVISGNGFIETKALATDGYAALVQAEKNLLSQLAVAIAATL